MVLAELGRKITSALQKLNKSTVINEAAVKECMGIICNALLGSDINVKYVMRLRENVMSKFKNEQDSGANLRNLIKAEVVR
jgi:signal recognition particle subunit SRP54